MGRLTDFAQREIDVVDSLRLRSRVREIHDENFFLQNRFETEKNPGRRRRRGPGTDATMVVRPAEHAGAGLVAVALAVPEIISSGP